MTLSARIAALMCCVVAAVSTLGWGYVTATVGARYDLIQSGSNSPIWTYPEGTSRDSGVSLSAAVIESEANECAIRKNLEALVKELTGLPLLQADAP